MKQSYDCRFDPSNDFRHCSTQEICAAKDISGFVEYKIDTTTPSYFENWYHDMDVLCMPMSAVMALGTAWAVSSGLSGIVCSGLAEQVGRKKTIVIGQVFQCIASAVMLLSKSYYMRLACCILLGMGRLNNGQCYTFGFEIVSKKYKSLVCSVINTWDSSYLMVFNLYWMFVSKNWYYFFVVHSTFSFLLLIVFVLFVPESPKHLLLQGKIDSANAALNAIAKFNGVDKPVSIGKKRSAQLAFMTPMMSLRSHKSIVSMTSAHSAFSDQSI
jgi:MFS family permease